jgi:hypothetical protein
VVSINCFLHGVSLPIRGLVSEYGQPSVEEPDHPSDALIRVVPLKGVGGLEQRVAADRTPVLGRASIPEQLYGERRGVSMRTTARMSWRTLNATVNVQAGQSTSVVTRWSGVGLQERHPLDKIRRAFRPMFSNEHRHSMFL